MSLSLRTRYKILFHDKWLIVLDKPEGVLSHPNPSVGSSGISKSKKASCAFEGPYDFPDRRFDTPAGPVWLIHRLDQDTSGVLLAALDRTVGEQCRSLFELKKIEKEYVALIIGRPRPASGKWKDYVGERREAGSVRAFVRSSAPPNAESQYSEEAFYPKHILSLIKINLITGKTHQIRVQASSRRHPVAGDEIYGQFLLNKQLRKAIGLRRLFLHAHTLTFRHPRTHEALKISSPLPPELENCLKNI